MNTNVSPVMLWAENAVEMERGFIPAVVEAIDQFREGNRTDMSILLTVTHGIKTDLVPVIEGERMAYAAPLKKIMGLVMPGITFKRDKAKASGVTYSVNLDATGDDETINETALRDLREIAAMGYTVKGDAFKAWVKYYTPEPEIEPKTSAETRAKAEKDAPRLAKNAAKAGHDDLAYMMALREQLNRAIAERETRLAIAAE